MLPLPICEILHQGGPLEVATGLELAPLFLPRQPAAFAAQAAPCTCCAWGRSRARQRARVHFEAAQRLVRMDAAVGVSGVGRR